MKQHFQILIIGGGNAGISLAAQLFRKDSKLDIAIMDPAEKHYYQPALTLVGGGTFDVNKTIRTEAEVMPKKASWIKEAAASFEPGQNAVTTATGNRYTYDYLVVAPGIQFDWGKIKGLEGNLGKNGITTNYLPAYAPYTWECLKNTQKGNAIFTNPMTPIKCGGAPQKIMYLASDYWRRKGLLGDVKVHYYSGATILFGVPKYAATLYKVIERYNIDVHLFHSLVEIRADKKEAVFDVYKDGAVVEQATVDYAMIHITPPQSAPDFIKNSPLAVPDNPFGWVDVNRDNFQHNRYPNIFSIGDASSTPNAKTGAAVRKQVPILVQHMISLIRTGKLVEGLAYSGYGSCPFITGYNKLMLAEFDYNNNPMETFPFDQSKERWSMYQMKKYVLPWMYWHKILKGTA